MTEWFGVRYAQKDDRRDFFRSVMKVLPSLWLLREQPGSCGRKGNDADIEFRGKHPRFSKTSA